MKKGLFPVFYILINITLSVFISSYVYADDVLPPVITISNISESQYYSTAVYPQISISDLNLSYSTVTLKFNNSADSVYVSGTEIKKDGRYLLSVSAFDSAGNASYESVNFVIDKTKPSISISGVGNNAYYSTDVCFKVKISETNPVKEGIAFDGNICLENETVWVKDEGKHKLVVDTLDKAGNSNLKEYNFTVDKTEPLIIIEGVEDLPAVEGGLYYSTFVTPYIYAIDSNLDTSSINLTLNGNVFENGTEIKEDGDFVLKVTASDLALNKSEKGIHFKLKASPRLSVTTRPGGAAVYLDGDYSLSGAYQGVTTGGSEGELIIENNLSCGKHLLKIKKPGYVDHIELINFGIGELIQKNIDLILCKKEYFNEGQLLDLDSANASLRPWVTDYDQDGKKDLVMRTSDSKDYLYLNNGSDESPQFDSSTSQLINSSTLFNVYYETIYENGQVPFPPRRTGTVHGSSDGKIYFDSSFIILADSTELDVGGHSWPFIFDLDHDGKDDLISGAQNGKIYFFKNIRMQENPIFDSAQLIQAGSNDLDIGNYSRPFVVDWNNDNLYDLIIGSSKGVYLYLAADSGFVTYDTLVIEIDYVTAKPPLNLNAETGISGRILLKWDEDKYFSLLGYNIYRDDKKINNTLVVKDVFLDRGLVDGNEYVYFVRAVNINGKESINSNEVLAVSEDLSAPSAPANLNISNSGLLSWEKPMESDLAGYYLYQGVDSNNLDNKIFVGAYRDMPSSSYQLNNLTPGVKYYFAVSAYDNLNKESGKSNIVSFLFIDTQAPAQVKGVRIRDTGNKGELKIKWQENSEPDLAGYKLYYGLNSSEYNAPLFVGLKGKYVLSGLIDLNKYFVAVSGVDTQGNEGLKSFEEIGIPCGNSTFIPSPEPLIIDPINRGVKLSWNLVSGIDGYKVYFGRSEDLVIAPLITSDTTFVFNNLLNNNKYYAAVSSFKGKDESERVSGIVLPKDVSAPDAPAGLTCLSGGNGTSLILSWSMNKEWDLSGYKIAYKTNQEYFSEPKIIEKTNRLEISGLTEGEQYTIALFSQDTENNTSNPSIITGIPLKTSFIFNVPPSAPRLDISGENGSVRLNWTSSGGELDEYRIYRREADELKYKKIYQTKNLTYKNLAVEEGKIYYYVVTAVSESSFPQESIFSNEAVMRPKLGAGDIEIETDVPVEGRVDGYDLIMLSISFGSSIGDDYYNPNADLNGDGVIDGVDLSVLANNFGRQY